MDFKKKFLELTKYTIPFGHEEELEPVLPDGWKKDSIGNYYYEVGESETLFTSHLDVATDKREKINHIVEGDIIKTDGTTILGGDNKAGCLVLFYLIENNVPGTYYFFLGEESAVHKNLPHGSLLAIEKYPDRFKKFKRAIAFDRKEMGQLVTRQLGFDCCSDEFADALINDFSKYGISYKKDKTGYYTDTAFFGGLIPEITNLSVGVWNEHTKNEYIDISYTENVAKAASKINWEDLPVARSVDMNEVDPRSDVVDSDLSEDQELFQDVFLILDDLYYVCREIRSYKNFVNYFRPGRKYHFTEWHGDDSKTIYIKDGKIYVNDKEFKTLDEFKKIFGIEKLDRSSFVKLMINEFEKNGYKLTLSEFSRLFYAKGGNYKKFIKDLKRSKFKLEKIGKGYQLIKESNISKKYIKTFENFIFNKN